MLFKKERSSYFIKVKIKFKALVTVVFCIDDLFLFLKRYFLTKVLLAFLMPIKTKPTGFCLVPPLGPAIPVIDTEILVLAILLIFFTVTFGLKLVK